MFLSSDYTNYFEMLFLNKPQNQTTDSQDQGQEPAEENGTALH